MTDIKARLDEIAKEAALMMWRCGKCIEPQSEAESVIRAAINKALEVVLTAEPSEGMVNAGAKGIAEDSRGIDILKNDATWMRDSRHAYRAMSSALLEELKNETPRP